MRLLGLQALIRVLIIEDFDKEFIKDFWVYIQGAEISCYVPIVSYFQMCASPKQFVSTEYGQFHVFYCFGSPRFTEVKLQV